MSPSASCAYSVMPMRTEPACSPGSRTHSCSLVYFRSSGYTGSPRVGCGCASERLLRRVGLGVLSLRGSHHGLDVEGGELVHVDGRALVLERGPRTLREVDRAVQRAGLADDVEDVRRGH